MCKRAFLTSERRGRSKRILLAENTNTVCAVGCCQQTYIYINKYIYMFDIYIFLRGNRRGKVKDKKAFTGYEVIWVTIFGYKHSLPGSLNDQDGYARRVRLQYKFKGRDCS